MQHVLASHYGDSISISFHFGGDTIEWMNEWTIAANSHSI